MKFIKVQFMETTPESKDNLLNVLAKMAPDSSKTTLRSWISEGRVRVDNQLVKRADFWVEPGQKVVVGNKIHFAERILPLIYEDNHLVAIEKPAGLLSVATAFEKEQTAHFLLKKHYHPRKVQVVHRLDQETSGVMVFALSDLGYKGLRRLFETHEIDRTYCAVVEGRVTPIEGSWQSYVYEDANYVVHSSQNPENGALAITHYRVEKVHSRFSRLRLKLETGRKNQIRVHCQESGHPIVGDKKYGAGANPIKRLCLHSNSLGFLHPVTGKKLEFISPIPEAFEKVMGER